MERFATPICLILCLGMLVAAFGLLAIDAPEPSVELHRARIEGDDAFSQVLERDLTRQIWLRRGVITALFAAAGILGVTAYRSLSSKRGWPTR